MSLVSCDLINRRASIDSKGIESYTYTYRVISDTFNESEVVVLNALALPVLWSTHPFNPNAICKSREATQDSTQFHIWTITIGFDTAPFEKGSTSSTPGDTSQQTPPDLRPPVIKYSSNVIQVPLIEDYTTPIPKKVVNSVGVPFDPLPTTELSIGVIHISFDSTTYLVEQKWTYENTVNETDVVIEGVTYGAGHLLWKKLDGNSQFENAAGLVWHIDCELWYNPAKRWDDLELLNAGTTHYTGLLGEFDPVQAVDNLGQPVTAPILLNADGTKNTTGTPNYIMFKKYLLSEFNDFL